MEERPRIRSVEDVDDEVECPAEAVVEIDEQRPAHGLVREAFEEFVFEGVGERAVPDVVQQRGGEGGGVFFGRDRRPFFREACQGVLHERHSAQGMREAGVFAAGEDQVADAELTDPPQTLYLGRLDQVEQECLRHRNESVDRIGEEFERTIQRDVTDEFEASYLAAEIPPCQPERRDGRRCRSCDEGAPVLC